MDYIHKILTYIEISNSKIRQMIIIRMKWLFLKYCI